MKTRLIPLVLIAFFATVACESRSSDKKTEPQKQDKPAPTPPGPSTEPQSEGEAQNDRTPTIPPVTDNTAPVTETPQTADVAPPAPTPAPVPAPEAQPKDEAKVEPTPAAPAEPPKKVEAAPAPKQEEAPAAQPAPKAEEQPKQAEAAPERETLGPGSNPLKLPALDQDERSTRTLTSIQQQQKEDAQALTEFVELQKSTHSRDLDQLQKNAINSEAIGLDELQSVLPHPEVKVVRLLGYVLAEPNGQDVPARVDRLSADLFDWHPGQSRDIIRGKELALKNAITAVATSKLGKRAGRRLFFISESVDQRVYDARQMNLYVSNVGIFAVSAAVGGLGGTSWVGRRLVSSYEAGFLPAIGVRSAALKNLRALGLESKTVQSLGVARRYKTAEFEKYAIQETQVPGLSATLLDSMGGHSLGERRVILLRMKSTDNPAAKSYYLTSDQLPREEAEALIRQIQTSAPDITRISRGGVAQYSGRRAAWLGGGTLAIGYAGMYSGYFLGEEAGRASESLELLSMVPTDRLKELSQH